MVHAHISRLICSHGCVIFWIISAIVYYITLYFSEQWRSRRKLQPPLHDRSFELLPRIDWFVYLTDGAGLVGAVFLAYWILFCTGAHNHVAKEALCYSAIGNYFSASLHSVTLLPSSEHATGVPAIFGGHSDKLMSNHTYHFGLYLRILVCLRLLSLWAVIPCILVYSTMLACTRSHYAVDIVLAWWALALVFVSAGVDVPRDDVCMVDWPASSRLY
mmetsp:Transcript_35407/g.71766  ORF Transcript_35407/g.71766 Transcript_35407/m.71766 type:complete len:217 (-) Transcript_35407:135-785(-)|eukprot:CAMPEP_0178691950 /NCGR_PEP_ID=MMETSP0699-20121125/6934_1 /TAXON_ID=265572 /ORGANISM="Extubocellulus spinifer, Strain CCMP396" /LENGTH=216 /DNA_ID=CAMNT_0020337293 /DNA_START=1993 /DNA_END=2643 /DNA_ORIENTATION=+